MKVFRSLRWRLQFWYALLLAAVLAGFGFTAYHLERTRLERALDDEIRQRLGLLVNALRPAHEPLPGLPPPPLVLRLGPSEEDRFDPGQPPGFYYAAWLKNGRDTLRSAGAPFQLDRPQRIGMRERGSVREWIARPKPGDWLLVGCDAGPMRAELARFTGILVAIGGGILVAGLLGGWWLSARVLRPIREISEAASKIATGNLAERIRTGDTDSELGELAALLNATFARLEAAFAQQARFTADAAHELRTPVTVILTHTENALATACAEEEHYEAFGACRRAAQRMRRLIQSLLQLSRIDAGQEPMRREPLDLAAVAHDAVDLLRPLAESKRIALELRLGAARCGGDAERVGQVLTNLVANAIQHHGGQGKVGVETRAEPGRVVAVVTDDGPGIAPEHLAHIFDRFYRADAARTGGAEHSGLGLAIAQAIVVAHGGGIAAESPPGGGARFTFWLPAD